jgi:prepilin-type N-terminal cleavage/methylation domain-containing protein
MGMKNLRQEKGLTLIELLGTLTIVGIVIGIAMMFLSSIYLQYNTTSQKFTDDTKISITMNTLTKYLTTSTKVIKINNNEYRFKSENSYMALIYTSNSLFLYTFTSGNPTNDDAYFANSTINMTNNSSFYTDPIALSNNVLAQDFQYWNGQGYLSLPTNVIWNGEMIRFTITFHKFKVDVWGNRTPVPITKTATVKLLQDR